MASDFQPIARLDCPGGEFIADARPWGENEAGGSRAELRYRYRGVVLAAIRYEAYYKNLEPWLRQGSPRIYNLGLNLDTSGASKTSGYDQGDTLYLPPSAFSQAEVEGLFDCLHRHQAALRDSFERTEITSSTLLGLMKTRTGTGRNGVARLVHADAPITALYGSGWLLIVVERGGRVLVHANLTANNPTESAVWGEVMPGKPPVLRARRELRFDGQMHDGALLLNEPETSTGRRLRNDFRVEWQ
ncbi:hypothetical protein GmRootA79_53380 (plasmid) [Acidovorax sp. A79]|uniref:hypothetical protein n=1 Tax=Acidovorax sp. A79 TaxID=3056107 RepID=UPI0034E8D628